MKSKVFWEIVKCRGRQGTCDVVEWEREMNDLELYKALFTREGVQESGKEMKVWQAAELDGCVAEWLKSGGVSDNYWVVSKTAKCLFCE